jgi:phosphoribosylaminoimidazole-succinocarboxamide synthase
MGSVKDLEIIKQATAEKMGIARFHFSDRYSVFDWGEMPDHITGKGASLCLMGAFCFERLEEKGILTHYRGILQNGKIIRTDELEGPTNVMEINLVRVIHPVSYTKSGKLHYDYTVFTQDLKNFLLPLEIIYRNSLPEGSSVFKRLKEGLHPSKIGLDHYPEPGEELKSPIFDVSTKLEEKDRYLTWEEAKKCAGLSDEETEELREKLLRINQTITVIVSPLGLKNEDGKVEFAMDEKRRIIVADVVGTLDECRFTYDGLHVSKEVARMYYKRTEWYEDVERAKREAEAGGILDWKTLCRSKPGKLDSELKQIISRMYTAVANEFLGRKIFDSPRLEEVIREYRAYLNG